MLPELGLAAKESPHPAIKPAFTASYEGFLQIDRPGIYRFDTAGTLVIGGEAVNGERALEAGRHSLRLNYQRKPGAASLGLSWSSDSFVKEPLQPAALWHTATTQAEEKGDHPAPPQRIREALAAMKCASCHDAVFLGTMHHKFQPDSLLTLMRHANPPKWYGAMTGPLLEDNETLTQLADDLRKLPHAGNERAADEDDPNRARAMVGTKQGHACIACHDIKHLRTEAETKGPNLAFITDRVSYDWFVRWMENPQRLKPGVPMPAFFADQEPAERQKNIDALWDYFSEGSKMLLPEELHVDPDQFVLKPSGRPMHTRSYMKLPDGRELLRAICVGLPNGVSYCFDSETCQLAYVWTGGFLDMAPHWQDKSGMPTPAIGEPFHLFPAAEGLRIGDDKPVFRGYEIIDGIPRFEFEFGKTSVRLLIDAPTPDSVRQTFAIGKRSEPIVFVAPSKESPVTVKASLGAWAENRLTIAETGEVELTLTTERKK